MHAMCSRVVSLAVLLGNMFVKRVVSIPGAIVSYLDTLYLYYHLSTESVPTYEENRTPFHLFSAERLLIEQFHGLICRTSAYAVRCRAHNDENA
jgi:hypothetical protein